MNKDNLLITEYTSRRKFIKQLGQFGKLGLFGATTFNLLSRCESSTPDEDDLDPPFIDTTNSTSTSLIFYGFNPESGFSGYNVWYFSVEATLRSQHASNNRTNVVNNTGTTTIAMGNVGGSFPSFQTSATVNQTTQVTLTMTGATSGWFIFVTAYNSTDNIDSTLSNVFQVP